MSAFIQRMNAAELSRRNAIRTMYAVCFVAGLLVGMLAQSYLTKYLDKKAHAAVESMQSASGE